MKSQKELESMSDDEIERILAHYVTSRKMLYTADLKPYCSNPSDIMPLVKKHKIDLLYLVNSDGVRAIYDNGFDNMYSSKCKDNTLRAATIVLILLLQEGEE